MKSASGTHMQDSKIKELYWAAGFVEGEGTFIARNKGLTCAVEQVQIEPLYRLQMLFGGSTLPIKRKILRKQDRSPISVWAVHGERAAGILMTLYKLMSPKRKAQIKLALDQWRVRKLRSKYATHCVNGHLRTEENTYHSRGWRACKPCVLKSQAKQRARLET